LKKCITLSLVVALLFAASVGFAHPGRTDGSRGHRDNRNVSGLGNYHYHCKGTQAHLHKDGMCPYPGGNSGESSTRATQRPASTPRATQRPSASAPKATIPPYLISDVGYLDDFVYGTTNARNVNALEYPSRGSDRITRLERQGTIVEIFGVFHDDEGQMWYSIWLEDEKEEAFVLAEFVDLLLDMEMASGF